MARSYYEVLGVARDADEAAIKKAFRKLARENHPDHHPDDPRASERLKEINHAYSILSDAEKRKLYDTYGEDAERVGFDEGRAEQARRWQQSGGFGGFGGEGFDVEDLLGGLFGGGRRGGARGPAQGRHRTVRMTVDFTTSVLGGERTLQLDGESVNVRIPAGFDPTKKLRVRGRGLPGGPGAERGDLLIEVQVAPDPLFQREGDDLQIEVPITLGEALLGGSVEVPTLTTPVRIRVPPGTQPGRRMRIKGRGVAATNRPPGDLIVTLRVVLPEATAEVGPAVEALEALYSDDVRAELRARMG
jgi:DnaJ-class molecular chaperone